MKPFSAADQETVMAKTITPLPGQARHLDFDEIDRAVNRAHYLRSQAFTSALQGAYRRLFGKKADDRMIDAKGLRDCTSPA
jgi:hypothetical protein